MVILPRLKNQLDTFPELIMSWYTVLESHEYDLYLVFYYSADEKTDSNHEKLMKGQTSLPAADSFSAIYSYWFSLLSIIL